MNKLHWIHLSQVPIFEQLQLEEGLLRTDSRSFCIINTGSPRAIVMGISGDPETLIDLPNAKGANIPIIKRFSGGGTVIIDEETLFITFIMSKEDCDLRPFPEPIHRWAADIYQSAWNIPNFHLRENDYVIEDKKCGGNAQYIRKERWVHHTSFLWNYKSENMDFLLFPQKRPTYRNDRSHREFLSRLQNYGDDLSNRIAQLKDELVKRFYIQPCEAASLIIPPHRQATSVL